jgi:hypothetical protein
MKKIIVITLLLIFSRPNQAHNLVNTIWEDEIIKGHSNVYKFISSKMVDDYDCERDYTSKDTYTISKDTLVITVKDDYSSEDGGKAKYYRVKYLIDSDLLVYIGGGDLVNGKWKYKKYKLDKKNSYHRVK